MKMEETYDLDTFEEVEEWNESEIRSLITLIKANEFLVNKTNKDFFNKEKKNNAWKIIGNLLHKTEVEVQRKWKSLRTVFSRKLAQLKEKVPSGSGAAKEKSTNIEWEYWGDMQFLIPHMRHKSNRTSNFYKKPFLASSTTSGPLASTTSGLLASPLNNKNSVLKSSSEPFKNTMKCTAPESSLQNTNVIDFEFSNYI
ncbi:transcription factor Adf-1-like isoform X2 [Linepithema humile]|uniref:transcription factor Adf-1-like isoform X2 n=1 Tax=Linepithema humile TaxID=83485 RepID=UPI00351F61DB